MIYFAPWPTFILQDSYFQQVFNVLTSFRASEIDKAVGSLSSTELDVLMKYLYRAFGEPTEKSCAIVLQWHEKVSGRASLLIVFLF